MSNWKPHTKACATNCDWPDCTLPGCIEKPLTATHAGREEDYDTGLHKQLYPEANKKAEYILCAAIWFKDGEKHEHQPKNIDTGFVICGRRHHNCFIAKNMSQFSEAKGTGVQGFLTSKDRFVDRKEAAEIAFNMAQIMKTTDCLFSEDLY